MSREPHEHGDRLAAHRKDERIERLLAAANTALEHAPLGPPAGAAATAAGVDPAQLPLVYVVGVPRSGTTLLHQLLARHLYVSYVDNIVARFWLRPSVGIAVSRAVAGDAGDAGTIELRSRHGVTTGAAGPHEFAYFWRRWLPFDESPNHHLDAALRARVDRAGLRRQLHDEVLASAGRPFVLKNVVCGFHAQLLSEVHPRSLFVHTTRDLSATVRSILQSRLERYGSYETWWSLEPSTFPFPAGLSPVEQVVRQARDCRSDFDQALSAPGVTSLELPYEELCRDPRAALDRIRDAVRELGWSLPAIAGELEPLQASPGPRLPPALESELERAVRGDLLL